MTVSLINVISCVVKILKNFYWRTVIKRLILIILVAPLLFSISMIEGSTQRGSSAEDKQNTEIQQDVNKAAGNDILETLADYSVMEKEMYRNIYTKKYVVDYYTDIAGSREIAELILMYADNFELPFSTVFALVWTESKFKVRSVNHNKGSVDRGLFQLNSRSFPELTEADFFNMEKNIMYGVKYLKWCLDSGDNFIVALAMYNAGRTRVEKNGTPRMTLDYISRILSKKQELESGFKQHLSVCMDNSKIALAIN